jgi:3-hydroxypropionyl-CoA synthetase (ADP-forming)
MCLTEPESKRVCLSYGISVAPFEVAINKKEALRYASKLGYPLVLKIISPDIIHKSEIGCVVVGIENNDQFSNAYNKILNNVKTKAPNAKVQGMLIQKMTPRSTEIIVGLVRDAQFGPTIMFGLGGVFVETLRDISFGIAPIDEFEAKKMIEEIKGYPLLAGVRGRDRLDISALADAMVKVSQLAMKNLEIEQLDLNPIFVYPKGYSVADARISLNPNVDSVTNKTVVDTKYVLETVEQLEKFFNADTVAIVGASPKSKIGSGVLKAFINSGYEGKLYPVALNHKKVFGLTCYPSIMEIPDKLDLVVLVIQAPLIPGVLLDCAKKGVKNIIIVSASFKESGGKFAELQEKVLNIARKNDIRIIGPNCIGVFNPVKKIDTLFQQYERMVRPKAGSFSFISQSGTFICTFLEQAAMDGVGVSKFVSYGNRVDVDEADLITYLGSDSETKVIGMYFEGLVNGRKLMEAARKVVPKKPIIACKGGKTELARKAAFSHTGNIAGSYPIVKAAFRKAGIILAENLDELYAMCKALLFQPLAHGNKVAMITNGAGPSVISADLISKSGLKLATYTKKTIKKLNEILPPFMSKGNPVDLTASATSLEYKITLDLLLQDQEVDIVVLFLLFQDNPLDDGIIKVIGEMQKHGKPILCWSNGGSYTRKRAALIEKIGIPVYRTSEEVIAASFALAKYGEYKRSLN